MYGANGVVILILLYAALSHTANGYYLASDVSALRKILMAEYDKQTSPWGSEVVNVSAIFTVNSICDLDERLEKLTTVLTISIQWYDPNLYWNASRSYGIDVLTIDKDAVWVPEFYLYNQHYHIDYGIAEKRLLPVMYLSSGSGNFAQMITTETTCTLDTSSFPFDQHVCEIIFNSNKHNVRVESSFQDVVLEYFQPDGSWDVTDVKISAEYSRVRISIALARKPLFVLVNLILPMTLLALISPMVFMLPNESGDRVSFSITVLLATSVFMTIVADNVPAKSQPFPLILMMLFISYSLTIAVVIVVIINARLNRLSDSIPIPRPLIWLLITTRCLCYCFRRRHAREKKSDEDIDCEDNLTLDEGEPDVIGKVWTWNDVSWGIDMICMTLMYTLKVALIVVFMVVLQSKREYEVESDYIYY